MRKASKKIKSNYRKTVLRLPDLDHAKSTVLNSLSSTGSRRAYGFAIDQFIGWYCSEPPPCLESDHRPPIPTVLGEPRFSGCDDQSTDGRCKATGLRGC